MCAAAAGLGETDNDEVGGLVRLDLDPVTSAPALILRRRLFGDDSLESHRDHLLEKCFALALDVVEIPHGAQCRHQVFQQLLAAKEWKRSKVEILVRDEIEGVKGRRVFNGSASDLQW